MPSHTKQQTSTSKGTKNKFSKGTNTSISKLEKNISDLLIENFHIKTFNEAYQSIPTYYTQLFDKSFPQDISSNEYNKLLKDMRRKLNKN